MGIPLDSIPSSGNFIIIHIIFVPMKRILLAFALVSSGLLSGCDTAQQIMAQAGNNSTGLSTTEIASGLKQALSLGAERSGNMLSATDGFFKNAAIKLLLPPEAQKVENTLRTLGMSSLVDKAILSINRAAEDAASKAAPIFKSAITGLTITDALGILKGGNNAATDYLKSKTSNSLAAAFKPVVENSLQSVGATKYWSDVFNAYNKVAANKINPDLTAFVTEKAMEGIFHQVSLEEQKIRTDPVARTTELLKKVFAKAN